MRFYTGSMFPPEYKNQIFICEHGSWNRSKKVGYRVVHVRVDEKTDRAETSEVFAQGWLNGDETEWGRPVDVQVMPDGALLVSDDYAGAVYRISYK
jgi:glucose/arabinose dehydrogenase